MAVARSGRRSDLLLLVGAVALARADRVGDLVEAGLDRHGADTDASETTEEPETYEILEHALSQCRVKFSF